MPRSRPHLGGTLTEIVLVGTAYYLGARLGLSLSLVENNVTPLWPPTGIALTAFLLLGRGVWPGVALAALAVNLPISEGLVPAAATAVGNTLAPLVAAELLRRVGFRRQLDRQRDALAIVFLAALASMLISATIGTAALGASGAVSSDELVGAWAVWWTGDAMGVLAIAPFLLCLPLFWELEPWPRGQWVEAGAILAVIVAVTTWAAYSELQLLFLVLPLVGWASWRLQLRGAAPAAMLVSLLVTWSAAHGRGAFKTESLLEQMVTLQAFNACVALTSFVLAAVVTERIRTTQVQLSMEEARAQREHQIAETLQRSLLPDRLPEIPGVSLAARYVPATADVQVGGDWYDVVQLPGGLIGLAIGDVAGHGLPAAATMGQLRMALRAYAVQDPAPVSVMQGVHRLVSQLPMPEMVTVMYLVFDPDTGELRFTNAGHPPPLILDESGSRYLSDGLAPPVGVTAAATYTEAAEQLLPGATLVLYTDGLIERRGVSIQVGLDRLREHGASDSESDVDALCDSLLSSLLEQNQVADDIALLAMRRAEAFGGPLNITLSAEPQMLAHARGALRRWLRESRVASSDANEILVAAGEACANAVQHAYGAVPGVMDLEARMAGGSVEISVRDHGGWRPAADRGHGWGLQLMRSVMDSVEVDHDSGGTVVTMRRRVEQGEAP
jgi:serine phosphatase RsbU (regulator of sigma subunit)/integral membrane sensor domain MASE1/anti-sigma regulatory factor (Ser/Thr protein kinase)